MPDPDADRMVVFGLMEHRRYPDYRGRSLSEIERRVRAYERAVEGRVVLTFADYQEATGDRDEARFVRWEAVRADTEARLHRQ